MCQEAPSFRPQKPGLTGMCNDWDYAVTSRGVARGIGTLGPEVVCTVCPLRGSYVWVSFVFFARSGQRQQRLQREVQALL